MLKCPLCLNLNSRFLVKNSRSRSFYRCSTCDLHFAHPDSHLSSTEEKKRYATHNNQLIQANYRKFLNQMWMPLKKIIVNQNKQASAHENFFSVRNFKGLDFGCGPTTAFSQLAAEDGFAVVNYDPYFYNNENLLQQQYDFIWASEVFEHFYNPYEAISQVMQLLKPSREAVLATMTEVVPQDKSFDDWYYQNDPTHVAFYTPVTMAYIANTYKRSYIQHSSRVHFFILNKHLGLKKE